MMPWWAGRRVRPASESIGPVGMTERRTIAVQGIVQGVGFRPFVYGLATRLGLTGFVLNRAGGLRIEVEGDPNALDRFQDEVTRRAPPLAQIERVEVSRNVRPQGDVEFRILPSAADADSPIFVSPDVATCDACLTELFDPADRRYRYPLLNCTN